ncbi:MAG: hypothetical protein KAR40_09730 [Candidatus Sabulitectum sp.]|nr:hypothetical protein [Candidatus Sabulitectum sp.]
MVNTALKIIMWVLNFLSDRGESAPARLEKKEYEEFQALVGKEDPTKDDDIAISVLVRDKLKRVLRPEGSGPT